MTDPLTFSSVPFELYRANDALNGVREMLAERVAEEVALGSYAHIRIRLIQDLVWRLLTARESLEDIMFAVAGNKTEMEVIVEMKGGWCYIVQTEWYEGRIGRDGDDRMSCPEDFLARYGRSREKLKRTEGNTGEETRSRDKMGSESTKWTNLVARR